MRVLLTGATGFIGTEILNQLNTYGYETFAISRSSIPKAHATQVIKAELGSPGFIDAVLRQIRSCDAIVHFAACIDYDASNLNLTQTNCVGLQQLVTIANEIKAESFIYASSVGVIGDPPCSLISEQTPTNPTTLYHLTKLFGEQLLTALPSSGFSTCSLRITAPVGVNMPENRILPTFMRLAMSSKPIKLTGHGLRRQNYVNVHDIASAVLLCLAGKVSGVFNIAGPSCISNYDLAQMCVGLTGSSSSIECETKRIAEDGHTWNVSNQKANDAFGYQTKISVEETAKAIKDYYENSRL